MIDRDDIILLLFFAILVIAGFYVLLHTNSITKRSAQEQNRRGRRFLEKYELSWFNRLVVRAIGLGLIVGPGYLIYLLLKRSLHL